MIVKMMRGINMKTMMLVMAVAPVAAIGATEADLLGVVETGPGETDRVLPEDVRGALRKGGEETAKRDIVDEHERRPGNATHN